jgi:hypothetical protein
MTQSTVAAPGGVAGQAEELLACARSLERELAAGAKEVAEQVAAQGRADAIETVTGTSSLAKAAKEVAQLIAGIEGQSAGASPSGKGQGR